MFEGYALLSHDLLEIFLKILLFIGRCMMNVNQGSHDIKKTAEETFWTSDKIKTMGGGRSLPAFSAPAEYCLSSSSLSGRSPLAGRKILARMLKAA